MKLGSKKVSGDVKQAAKDLGLKVLSVSKGPEPLILTDDGVFTPTAILEEAAFVTRRQPKTR